LQARADACRVYALLTDDTIVSSIVCVAEEAGRGDLVPAQIQLKMTPIAPFGMVMMEIAGQRKHN
jgi:hypothetical protein